VVDTGATGIRAIGKSATCSSEQDEPRYHHPDTEAVTRLSESGARPAGIDTSVPNVARIYDYVLGGKDNISQVVPAGPYSGRTPVVQARQAYYSKIVSFAVRGLCGTSLGGNVRFSGRGFLTLA
jgi:hypothetical protein